MKRIVLFLMFICTFSEILLSSNNRQNFRDCSNEKLDILQCAATGVVSCCILASCLIPQQNFSPKFLSSRKNIPTDIPEQKKCNNIEKN